MKPGLPLSVLQIKPHCSTELFLFWFMKTDLELIQPRYSFRKERILPQIVVVLALFRKRFKL